MTRIMAAACVLAGTASLVSVGLGANDHQLKTMVALNSATMLGLVLSVRREERRA